MPQSARYQPPTTGKTRYHNCCQPPGGSAQLDLRDKAAHVAPFGWDHVLEGFDKYTHVARHVTTPYARYLQELGPAGRLPPAGAWRVPPRTLQGWQDDCTTWLPMPTTGRLPLSWRQPCARTRRMSLEPVPGAA